MKRLIRFLELWLGADCPDCIWALEHLKEYTGKGENEPPTEFNLIVSKKPGSEGKIHEFHLSLKK